MSLVADQSVSHYRLAEKIGEGASGVVWRAVDTRLEREVALKFLADDLAGRADWLRRFLNEARTVAALNHPNIVTIHAIEEVDGTHFLVMELVRGRKLGRLVPEGGLPLEEFFDLAIPVVDAVRTAHASGVVHRDLKPGNIMVDDGGRPRILDFGLARSLDPMVATATPDEDTTTRTLVPEERFAGTIPYMSPEQVRGETPDNRSDLFSLGVVFYQMVTGRRPFTGGSRSELIASILRDEPAPVTEPRPELPRQLARILRHALHKDPRRRFQTARDLGNELEELRDELAAGRTTPLIRSLAVMPLANVSGDREQDFFADGMTDVLINNLARIRALKVISRTSVMQYRETTKPLPVAARELGVDAIVEGSVLRAGGRVRITARLVDATRDRTLWAHTYEQALVDVLRLQGQVAHSIVDRIELELTPQERVQLTHDETMDPAVHEAYLRGRHLWYRRTTESVREGLASFQEAIRLDPSYAPAHAGVADSYIVDGGRYLGVTPDVAYARARAAAERALELDDALAEAHTSLAAVMTDYDWEWEGADREYRRAIELSPSYATAHGWYAEHLSRMGRHDEAIAEVRRALELDPVSIFSSMLVAWILYFARRYEEAIAQAVRTLERDPEYATAHRILGWAYEETDQHAEAVAAHRRACELTGDEPNFTAQLGRAYAVAGRIAEAREVLDDLVAVSRERYVSALDIGIIHLALGDRGQALGSLERALEERADHLPYLGVNPRLDALRDEPRFRSILERMGLG